MRKEKVKNCKILRTKRKQLEFLISMGKSQNVSQGKFYTLKCMYKRKSDK